jgi:hypothetical protein
MSHTVIDPKAVLARLDAQKRLESSLKHVPSYADLVGGNHRGKEVVFMMKDGSVIEGTLDLAIPSVCGLRIGGALKRIESCDIEAVDLA